MDYDFTVALFSATYSAGGYGHCSRASAEQRRRTAGEEQPGFFREMRADAYEAGRARRKILFLEGALH
jgi:hypothetical protein